MYHPTAIVESSQIGSGTRVWAYAHILAGAKIGSNVNIGDHAFVEGGAIIGDNVTIKNAVCIWSGIAIEDDVFIGPSVTFTNDRHPRSPRMDSARQRYASPENWLSTTVVKRGCSIGAAATICPGLVLGEYSMIAAGAVVTRDVTPFALVMGVPAIQRADVCTCGHELADMYDNSTCEHCGETPAVRLAKLNVTGRLSV